MGINCLKTQSMRNYRELSVIFVFGSACLMNVSMIKFHRSFMQSEMTNVEARRLDNINDLRLFCTPTITAATFPRSYLCTASNMALNLNNNHLRTVDGSN